MTGLFSLALEWLAHPVRALVTALTLALLIGLGVQTARLSHAKHSLASCQAQVTALEAEKTTLLAEIATLGKDIKAQNTAVAALQAAGEAQAKTLADAQATATKQRQALEKRLAALRREKVPTDCPGAVDWLGAKGREQAKRWEGSK